MVVNTSGIASSIKYVARVRLVRRALGRQAVDVRLTKTTIERKNLYLLNSIDQSNVLPEAKHENNALKWVASTCALSNLLPRHSVLGLPHRGLLSIKLLDRVLEECM